MAKANQTADRELRPAAAVSQPEKPPRPKPMHTGHRDRMRQRVKQYGLQSLAEHEVLEYLLYFAIPRQDTNPIAHRLLERFHTVENVLAASEKDLCRVEGVGPATAEFLHMLHQSHRYCELSRVKPPQRLTETRRIVEYLVPLFRGQKREQLLVLALDDRDKLLRTLWLESGTVGAVDVSVHKLAAQVMDTGAAAVILAHNHPGGLTLPSQDDIIATGNIMRALGVLQVRVRDHIIVAGEEASSMRETGRLPYFNHRTGELTYFPE